MDQAKFPQWYQPTRDIGQILVHSQEELDELKQRDWTPKPIPGTEAPPPVAGVTLGDMEKQMKDLQTQMDVMRAEAARLRPARTPSEPVADGSLASVLGLSDAEGTETPADPPTPSAPVASKKPTR